MLVVAGVVALIALGGGGPSASPPASTHPTNPTTPSTTPLPKPPFAVGTLTLTLTEPGRSGAAARTLPTTVRYPAVGAAGAPDQAGAAAQRTGGPYPLIIFSEGYGYDPEAYAALLNAWAVAGYVVVDPVYPFTSPTSPGGLVEGDIVNHPADLSFVITSMLDDSDSPGGTLTGMIDSSEVGVIGHSDGGDVSLAATANTCCHDNRIKAAVILSGAEWTIFGGTYFATPTVPMLVVQGTADTVNPPSCSVQLYNQGPPPKYYLSLTGASHTDPYGPTPGPWLGTVAKVTVDFLDGYLRHSTAGLAAISPDGTVAGLATVATTPTVPAVAGPCAGAPAG